MKAVLLLSILIILQTEAWSAMRSPFPYKDKIRQITDCMHVTSEEGEFIFKKNAMTMVYESELAANENSVQMVPEKDSAVCGFYVVADPYKTVEISFNHLDATCDSGALLGFVDGWELNGEYFPNIHDHRLPLNERVSEFCVKDRRYPYRNSKRTFTSSQNAALLQYRIPKQGSFMITVKFHSNPDPCHIMAEDSVPFYVLKSSNKSRNCTLTALYPAVVSLLGLHIGHTKGANYECDASANKLIVGGSSGLDSSAMEASSQICGNSDEVGPKQAIFCGVTTVRLSSTVGSYSSSSSNSALIVLRKAEEEDIGLATLICQL